MTHTENRNRIAERMAKSIYPYWDKQSERQHEIIKAVYLPLADICLDEMASAVRDGMANIAIAPDGLTRSSAEIAAMNRDVAVWDGWVELDGMWIKDGGHGNFDYANNIATLWPVAKRVCEEIQSLIDIHRGSPNFSSMLDGVLGELIVLRGDLRDYLLRFDISKLFASVHAGVVLLNKYNNNNG